jgi:hypothetical protein
MMIVGRLVIRGEADRVVVGINDVCIVGDVSQSFCDGLTQNYLVGAANQIESSSLKRSNLENCIQRVKLCLQFSFFGRPDLEPQADKQTSVIYYCSIQ